ncbi:MAG: hypothetical protein MR936_16945 [Eubacterium sp.]|nr:hypothetical protein [Eubacterium sp.]
MNNKIPNIKPKIKVSVICEGPEEYDYMYTLSKLNVWNEKYEFDLVNAGGNGNIPARYQDKYQNDTSDVVLVFCDTDKKPYEQYEDIKRKINEFHGVDDAADAVVIFGNPCTMQIVIEHWQEIKLKSSAKRVNAPIIQECTGIENYKGREEQRQEMMHKITSKNYGYMKERIGRLSVVDTEKNSSNIGRFLEGFESEDDRWIKLINKKLE